MFCFVDEELEDDASTLSKEGSNVVGDNDKYTWAWWQRCLYVLI